MTPGSVPIPPAPAEAFLRLSTLPIAVMREDGTVDQATPAFRKLVLGPDAPPEAPAGWRASSCFLQPRWSDLLRRETPPALSGMQETPWRLVYEGALSFGTEGEVARSAECQVFRAGARVLLIAGLDPASELLTRRVLELNEALGEAQRAQARTIRTLEQTQVELRRALAEVRTLRGLLPVCAHCRRIRSEEGAWEQIETYVERHTEAEFSHGICDACLAAFRQDLADKPGP